VEVLNMRVLYSSDCGSRPALSKRRISSQHSSILDKGCARKAVHRTGGSLLHQADRAHELSGGVVGTLNRLEAVGRVVHELLERGPHLRRDVVALQVAEA
jgi:hypothetical protein